MTDLEECLFAFVKDRRMEPYLHSSEYHRKLRVTEKQWQRLLRELTPEQKKHLSTYRDVREDVIWEEQLALFQAALATGLELGRLPMSMGQ